MPNSGTSSHHRGDSSSSIRRRSADEQRGDSAYGSRGGREERGSSERVRDRREVSDREREESVQCVSPEIALGQHRAALTALERSEILEYPRVYFAGIGAKKVRSKEASGVDNHGYDDDRGDYVMRTGDHLGVSVRDHRRSRERELRAGDAAATTTRRSARWR
jgi:dual specificity tyrosine-phosphorylation-regulated kinase 2/3/4